jgi:serine protease Do
VPIREAPLASDDTPAAKVYRERAATVVVLHTRSPVPSSGPLAAIYGRLGISFSEGLGSGFVVEANGLVVTNHHVIDGASSLQMVTKDGATFDDVSVLVDDARDDLALLSVPGKDLAVAPLAGPKPVAVGARAIAIGCPLGFEYTLTEGIVSAHRNIEGTRFLQMQTGIAPGSSGGPLFDQNGNVIGVNTATSGGGMNLAVDAAEVAKLLTAPRTPRALERFVQGPRLASLETEGGDLDPTTRMNLREAASLLSNIALKCAKPLPDDAQVTLTLPKQLGSEAQTESNLTREAETCMTTSLRLLALQLSLVFSQAAKPPAAITFTIADLPREDGSSGTLAYHFKR